MKSSGRFRLFRPASWSFATRATVVPSLGLVLMAVVIALLVNRTVRNLQLESLQTDFELLGQAQARRVTQIVVRQVSLLNALAQSSVIVEHAQEHQEAPAGELPANHAEASARVRKQIDLFLRRFPQFTSVVITDAEGKLIASSADTGRTDYSGEEWHTFTVSGVAGRLYLSDRKAVMPEAEAGEGIEIALPVLNEIDQPIGAIYAVWDVSRAADLTAGVESGRVMILNQQGLVVADSVEGTVGRAVLSPELLGEFQAKTLGSAVGPDENGTQTVFGYSNLVGLTQVPEYELVEPFAFDVAAPIRALGWTVVASQDAELALAATGLLSRRILALLGSGTVVIVVGVFVFARTLVAPLGHLTEAARSIGAGQLDTPIPQLGEDEVGQLAEVLRGMVARLVQRVDQLRAASQVTHAVQATLEVERMLQNATDAIHDWFGFPLVRVYLLNPDEQVLTLQAEAGGGEGKGGPGGMSRVSVGWPNVIGNAVQFSRSQVGSGAGTLAGEGSELAVPLRLGEEILGVLYMAAREPDAFGAEEVSVMELLADQIGMSVQNARLFEQSEASLRQIEALNRRLTREGWVDYVGERGQLRYALRAGEEGEQSWPESLAEAAERGTPIARPQESEDGQAVLAVPIVLRGEVVGTLGVRRPAGHQWSDEEIGLVQAVAERVALIAEGIRLLDGADRTARREQVVSSVSAKLQHATDVDLLLQTALSELSGALGSDNISLRIGPPPEPGEEGGSEGGEDGKAEDQPR